MLLPALIRKECLLVLRDRQGLALLFLLPMVFILIMSLAMQGALQHGSGTLETVLVDDADRSPASEAFIEALAAGGRFNFNAVDEGAPGQSPAESVRAGDARIAVRIPSGFSAALAEDPASDLADAATPRLYFAPALIPEVRRIFTLTAEGSLQYVRVRTALEALSEEAGTPDADLSTWLGPDGAGLQEEVVYAGDRPPAMPNAVQQSVPAWLVFSMFFVVAPIAASLIVERDQGTLLRLRQMNVSPFWLLGSRLVPYYAINMLQLVLMLAVGVFLVPLLGGERLELGDSPVGLWLIGSAVSLGAICPGRTGRVNFTRGIPPMRKPGATARTCSRTWSSKTTPGTTGLPGKWPGRLG